MAIVMEGPLSKWTNVVKGWQYRWFVLDDNTGLLSYYTSKEKMMRGSRRGCLRLKNAAIGIDDEDDSTFTISCDQKTFHFQARDSEERDKWVRALEDTIMRHSQTRKRTLSHLRGFHPGEEDLNKRLDEAQAYYNLLTDQVKALQMKMDSEEDCEDSERYEVLREESAKMLEAIGKSLGLMHETKETFEKSLEQNQQKTIINDVPLLPMVMDYYSDEQNPPAIAQPQPPRDECFTHINTADIKPQNDPDDVPVRRHSEPELATLVDPTNSAFVTVSQADKPKSKSDLDMSNGTTPPVTPVSPTSNGFVNQPIVSQSIPVASEPAVSDPVAVHVKHLPPKNETLGFSISPPGYNEEVPIRSYSSSEDEDEMEFFDADEYHNHGNTSPSSPRSDVHFMRLHSEHGHDVIADEDTEFGGKEVDSMEEHHSILMHLLSQVRLGMDLTKVTLPTFVLEKRSLLEMYADFFAHPDLFVSIADGEDPRERMVRLVRYYLSTFHAGRKASVAKKPYNPILGEVFKCLWSIDDEKPKESDRDKVSDGPVPFATKGDVTFLAEQVSHHPPISAFYAEHYDKRISFCAHIWTKSKFLGLSVGVENVGQGCVSVLEHDEEYIVTFPNGYCRSILSVPWVELGGKITITCPKTGYSAILQFHTKPFYGGKKHRVTGEVLGPNDKKPFLTCQGEWNGVIYAKFEGKEEEVFIDTTTLPITSKKVQKIEKQFDNESRKMWSDVTNALKDDDIDRATEGKHKLEEKQRADAKYRKENNLQWETKLFHEIGEHWIYDNPLQKRLQKLLSQESPQQASSQQA